MGLSPESPEDEAGIKRAAENSKKKLKKLGQFYKITVRNLSLVLQQIML